MCRTLRGLSRSNPHLLVPGQIEAATGLIRDSLALHKATPLDLPSAGRWVEGDADLLARAHLLMLARL
jgi:hypothetical protein